MATNFLTACEIAVNKAAGRDLTNEEMLELVTSMDNTIKRIKNENQAISLEDAALKAAEEIGNNDRLARVIEAKNRIINEKIFLEVSEHLDKNFADRPEKGLAALLDGGNEARTGGRDSAAIEQKNLLAKYENGLYGDLERAGLLKIYSSGTLDKEITIALDAIGRKLDTKSMNSHALEIATHIRKWQEVARLDANRSGAWIGSVDGYVTRQTHDIFKIRGDTFENWRDLILAEADHKASFGDAKDIDQVLRAIYDNLATGNHLRDDQPDWLSGFKGGGSNIAKKASQARVIHFKDGESWFRYNEKYGTGNLRETVALTFNRMAKTTGLMRRLGTNPENMLNRLKDRTIKKLRKEKVSAAAEADFTNKFNGMMQKLYPEVAGLTNIPGSHMMARISANFRAVESLTKLGGATLSSLNDIPMGALEMKYQGQSFFSSLLKSVTGRLKRYSAEDRKELAIQLGVYAEGMASEVSYRFSGDTSMAGGLSKAMRTYFKLNLLTPWTEGGRHSAAFMTSNWLARNAKSSFDNLNTDLKRVLSLHNIERAEWDVYRKMETYSARGNDYMTPEMINTVADQDIAGYLTAKGLSISKTAIVDARGKLQDKLRKYILDRSSISVGDPTPRTKAVLNQGTQAGTIPGELMRFIGQFKAFPVSFMQKHLGRELFGRGYTPAALGQNKIHSLANALKNGNGELLGLANMIVWMTAFGYLSMQTKLMAKGQTPRPASFKTVQAAFLQGGGAGIYGDFLFGEFNRFGGGFMASLAGPTFGSAEQISKLYQSAMNGEAKAADGFRLLMNHTPFLNIPYIKATMDFLILNRMQESMSPGSLDRYRERLVKEQGNDFIIPPSQFMLGK